jgi:glycerophosphoryl diester phosphodiesterase
MTRIYAHRGFSGLYPENTLLAFRQAFLARIAGIELDVHATSDGVPVVIHDRSLERTTNRGGDVNDLMFAQVRALDAGAGERVPALAEVLELVGDRVHLDIEVKGRGIEAEVLGVLAEYPAARWAISSFNWETLRRVRQLAPSAELWPLADDCDDRLFNVAAELGSPAVALAATAYTPRNAAAIKRAGLEAMIWTVNDPDEAILVRDLGAFALCTDYPDRIVAALSDERAG